MNDGVDLVLLEDLLELVIIEHVALIDGERLARDLLHGAQGVGGGIAVIVHHNDVNVVLEQLDAGVTADEAGASGNQYVHDTVSFPL